MKKKRKIIFLPIRIAKSSFKEVILSASSEVSLG